jgi:hypothetical protein
MEVGIRQGVCNDSPAEATGPENGWRSSGVAHTRPSGQKADKKNRGEDLFLRFLIFSFRFLGPRRVGRRGGGAEGSRV